MRYRHLSRKSAARKALLRSQVTALVLHEHIQTTYAKAKESQRLAEKLITLAKRDTVTSRKKVQGMLYVWSLHLFNTVALITLDKSLVLFDPETGEDWKRGVVLSSQDN